MAQKRNREQSQGRPAKGASRAGARKISNGKGPNSKPSYNAQAPHLSDSPIFDETAKRDIAAVILIILAVVLFATAVLNPTGVVTGALSLGLKYCFGIGTYVLPFILVGIAVTFLVRFNHQHVPARVAIGLAIIFVAFLTIIALTTEGASVKPNNLFIPVYLVSHGGYVGAGIAWACINLFGLTISYILMVGLLVLAVVIIGFSITQFIEKVRIKHAHFRDGFVDSKEVEGEDEFAHLPRMSFARIRRANQANHPLNSNIDHGDTNSIPSDKNAKRRPTIARSIDGPDDYVFELFSSSMLKGHALGLPVLGTKERVGTYTHADCERFHNQHYHTGNLVVSAAGHLDHDALVRLVENYFSDMATAPKEQHRLAQPNFTVGLFGEARDIEQAHIVYGFPWHGLDDDRRYATSVLSTILGGSMSSRLFQEVREMRGLVYSIFTTQMCYHETGQWCIYAGTRPDNLAQVKSLIEIELKRIVQEPVSADELSRTIDLICGQLLLGMESTNSHMVRLGKRETLGLPQISADEQVDAYRQVSASDVQAAAQEFLTGKPTIAVVSPYDIEELNTIFEN